MSRRIYYDGLNLALERGTGIATYTRLLANLVRELGYEVGVVYSTPQRPSKNPLLREISLFDAREAIRISHRRQVYNDVSDIVFYPFGLKPSPVSLSGAVIADNFRSRLPVHDHVYIARNLFNNAREYFSWTQKFVELSFDTRPDILHCTYQMPVRSKGACNIYTIHDLVPLRLPFTTLDNKRFAYRLFRKLAAEADHIVTVSENSKRDIIELLGVEESRVTNTYESVSFPREYIERSDDLVAEQLRGSFGLEAGNYLLFYGALEPKKNVARLIDAYQLSAVDVPLVITGATGWGNEIEKKLIDELRAEQRPSRTLKSPGAADKRRLYHFEFVSVPMLVTLIRGAKAVVFPSLYEGFGLPVLEAMLLGTPVITSHTSSIPEIAGEAALYVNPYETDEIARAIKTIVADSDMRAELSRRGRVQAELFSVDRYRERVKALYEKLG